MSKAIDDLLHEHEAIRASLRILDVMTDRASGGAPPERADLEDFTGFLTEFADRCHHGKEEGFLFPALAEAGILVEGGPIGVLLADHALGRAQVSEMIGAVSAGPDYAAFASAAGRYSALLGQHIQKENDVLFPLAEKTLDTRRLDGIYRSFEEHEENVIGRGRHEELHGMLERLESRYLQ